MKIPSIGRYVGGFKAMLVKSVALVGIGFGGATANDLLAADYAPIHPLPSNYTRVEFVESSGSQYIDTGYAPKVSDVITAVMCVPGTGQNTWAAAFGVRAKAEVKCYQLDIHGKLNGTSTDYTVRYHRNKPDVAVKVEGFFNRRVEIVCNGANLNWRAVGAEAWNTISATSGTSGDCEKPLFIFGLNNGDSGYTFNAGDAGKLKLFSFRIATAAGVVKRDYIPCLNASGDAGLWDTVEGKFATKTGTLTAYRQYSYIESTGDQYLDTGITPVVSDVIKADIYAYRSGQGTWATAFGVRKNDTANVYQLDVHTKDGDGTYRYHRGTSKIGTRTEFFDRRISLTCSGKDMSWKPVGDLDWLETLSVTTSGDCLGNLLLFALKQGTQNPGEFGKLRFYSFAISKADGTPRCELVPAKKGDGTIGMYDVNGYGTFRTNGSGSNLKLGCQCFVEGTVFYAYEGALTADDLAGSTLLEKVGDRTVTGAGISAIPVPFTLSEGVFSLADGEAKEVAVNGALTLKGGATLKIDVVGTACDTISASSVAFVGATAENPVTIDIASTDADWTADKVVIGSGVTVSADGVVVTHDGTEALNAVVEDGKLIVRRGREAHWTGAADDNDVMNPENWQEGELPDEETTVYFTGSATPDIPVGAIFAAKQVAVDVTLAGDRNWLGLNPSIPVSGRIDLRGHNLTVANLPSTWDVEITDTSAAGPGGELHVNVASGKTVENTTVALAGSAKLVKDGAGTLVWSHNDDGSVCTVAEGTLKGGVSKGLFSTITVAAGATFDFNGTNQHSKMKIVSDGGTLTSSKEMDWNSATFSELEITADTIIKAPVGGHSSGKACKGWGLGYGAQNRLTLHGNRLVLDIGTSGAVFWLFGTTVADAGTVELRSGGYLCLHSSAINAPQMTFIHTGGCFIHNQNVMVANYSANAAWDTSSYGTGTFVVSGVFAPNTDYYMNTKLLDGATLDLSRRTTPLSLTGTVSRNQTRHLTFASGATITVIPPDRPGKIIAWSSIPAGVTFKRAEGVVGRFVVKDDGLYFTRGLMLIFQ